MKRTLKYHILPVGILFFAILPGFVLAMSRNGEIDGDMEINITLKPGVELLSDVYVKLWESGGKNILNFTGFDEAGGREPIPAGGRELTSDDLGKQTIKITGKPGIKSEDTIVELKVYMKDGSGEEVEISSDKVVVTVSLFIMDRMKHNFGQELAAGLDPNQMWTCNLKTDTYETPKMWGIDGLDQNNNPKGDSYLESALKYTDAGFTLNMDYTFQREHDQYGHLHPKAQVKVDKLSFVANGGVKLGNTGGFGDGVFEVALLDVRAMVHMVFDRPLNEPITDGEFSLLASAIKTPVNGRIRIMVNGVEKVYAPEQLSALLHAVGYGQSYDSMGGYNNFDPQSGLSEEAQILKNAYELSDPAGKGKMIIVAYPLDDTNYSRVTIRLGETPIFDATGPIGAGNGKIYLQSHWGSGVVYKINSLKEGTAGGGS